MKIGLLLGSFDPIHMGHLHMAMSALNNELVDEVIFVPSVQNPWKQKSTGFRNRCIMVQLAIDDMEHCKISTVDQETETPHYSSNTLRLLKEEYSADELFLIVGADTALNIRDWHEGEWILENFKLITVTRPGYGDPAIVDIPTTLNISSTEIRELVKKKKQIYPLVPRIVSQCIKHFDLYK